MIFGIGFPRTGTHSLRRALEILGFAPDKDTHILLRNFYRGNFKIPGEWDMVTGGISHYYIALDKKYPGSKFVLTLRDEDDWLDSVNRVWRVTQNPPEYEIDLPGMWRHMSHCSYDLDVLRALWRSHSAGAREYFAGRDDFVAFDASKSGWQPLCEFLSKSVPEEPYPHENMWPRVA